ncbi:PilN domain-containing protein [Staphylospora marina]|uniref:PilN domain-containing protein n=1 Tax=Staphylospora marina TaxID=2490858 RepID=UPI000F5BE7A5|nr:hypothetical protein [Staphylospora marina]
MNFLPPRPPGERYFAVWFTFLLLVSAAGALGLFLMKDRMDERLAVVRAETARSRETFKKVMDRKNAEERLNREHRSQWKYRDVTDQLNSARTDWKKIIEWTETALPAGARLFHLNGAGNRLEAAGLFPDMHSAAEFVKRLADEQSGIEEAWIDCAGSGCATVPPELSGEQAGKTVIRFHITVRTEKGGEGSSDARSQDGGDPQGL